jgi:hypothetical protein
VTVRCETGRKIDGVRCRRCRYPAPEEIVVHTGVAVTTPARTLVDMAGLLGIPSLRQLVERAAVLKLLSLESLDRSLEEAKGRRGRRALYAILEAWRTEDGSMPDVRSDFEALVLPHLLEMGLPRPACNKSLLIDGERFVIDFLWEEPRLVVETDGEATHGTPVAFQRDRRRDQILIANDYRIVRATWDQIEHELDAVVARIAQTLALPRTSSPTPSVVP